MFLDELQHDDEQSQGPRDERSFDREEGMVAGLGAEVVRERRQASPEVNLVDSDDDAHRDDAAQKGREAVYIPSSEEVYVPSSEPVYVPSSEAVDQPVAEAVKNDDSYHVPGSFEGAISQPW